MRSTAKTGRIGAGILGCLVLLLLNACIGTVEHTVKLNDAFTPHANTLVAVGPVTNQSGHTFKVSAEQMYGRIVEGSPEQMLSDALTKTLRSQKLLWSEGQGPKLVLDSTIVEYEAGNAFQRWLLPGWGSTVLTVRGDLRDGEKIVGSVDARRTVSFGGLYSVGAWATVFGSIAEDIVGDLRTKIPSRRSAEQQGK